MSRGFHSENAQGINSDVFKWKKNMYFVYVMYVLVLERTPKYQTSNTPNIELSKHHILAQNRTSNMSNITKNRTIREHQTVCSKTSLVT